MMGILERCRCCHASSLDEKEVFRGYRHFVCEGCGYEFFYGETLSVDASLYESDADYAGDLNVFVSPEDLVLWHHVRAIDFIRTRYAGSSVSALDIGCFNGFFVKKLCDLGHDAYGIDFNRTAISYGQKNLGLASRISVKTLDEMIDSGARFDVVTLFEVLEHIEDIGPFLNKVAKLVKDKGVMIVSTPNKNMCWRPALDFPPHHLSRFTLQSLERCLQNVGLRKLCAFEQMSSYDLIRHYVGTFFRSGDKESMRGGAFRHEGLSIILRRMMNRSRKVMEVALLPLDRLLYLFGLRYISQVIMVEKHTPSESGLDQEA